MSLVETQRATVTPDETAPGEPAAALPILRYIDDSSDRFTRRCLKLCAFAGVLIAVGAIVPNAAAIFEDHYSPLATSSLLGLIALGIGERTARIYWIGNIAIAMVLLIGSAGVMWRWPMGRRLLLLNAIMGMSLAAIELALLIINLTGQMRLEENKLWFAMAFTQSMGVTVMETVFPVVLWLVLRSAKVRQLFSSPR